MDWSQYFVDFMNSFPWGSIILGICGGVGVMAPVFLKVKKFFKELKDERDEDKKEREAEAEARVADKLEEKAFRKKIWGVIDELPQLNTRLEDLSVTTKALIATEDSLKASDAALTKQMSAINEEIDKFASVVARIESTSTEGDKELGEKIKESYDRVSKTIEDQANSIKDMSEIFTTQVATVQQALASNHEAINMISNRVEKISSKVDIIVESDLESFRNFLLTSYTKFVRDKIPLSKHDVEEICVGFNRYKKEGGNGWAERLYHDILGCPTADGISGEEVAKQLRYIINDVSNKS